MAEEMWSEIVEADVNMLKDSLKQKFETLILTMKPMNVLTPLFTENVISQKEREHILQEGERKGPTSQCELLMDYILKKSDLEIRDFMLVIKEKEINMYKIIMQTAHQIKSGVINVDGNQMKEIQQQLINAYNEKTFHIIEALPGEVLVLNLKENKYVMPVDFTTQVKYCEQHLLERLSSENVTYDYKNKKYETVEDVIMELHQGKRVVACLGPTGNGKSVLIHRLVCQWMDQPGIDTKLSLEFDLIIALPLREVNTSGTLTDIMGRGIKGLQYFPHDMMGSLQKCFQNKDNKILLLIDGIDEVDIPKESELYQILTGVLYPSVKIFFTARPEATILRELDENLPDFKMYIHGTTTQGVYDYLKAVLTYPNGPNKEQVSDTINQCEQYMMDFPMLKVPLYLTLIAWVFDNEWINYASFANFQIPKTTTMLMNACLCVILRIWMKRLNRETSIKFDMNPIHKNSTVPNDIKAKLVSFGFLCFEGLLHRKYEFDNDDMNEYLIYDQDIIHSGLFASTATKGGITFFCRHKVFQEYLAAIYLSKLKFRESVFRSLIDTAKCNDSSKQTLLEILARLENVFQFICGIEPEFAAEIIKSLHGTVCLAKSFHKSLNLHYESVLFTEASHQMLKQTIVELVTKCEVVKRHSYNYYTSASRVQNLCEALTMEESVSMLQSACNFVLRKEQENWVIISMPAKTPKTTRKAKTWNLLQCISKHTNNTRENQSEKTMIPLENKSCITFSQKEPLDETVYMLLLKLAPLKEIKTLKGHSYISNLDLIQVLFPNIVNIDIEYEERNVENNMDSELASLLNKLSEKIKHSNYSEQNQHLLEVLKLSSTTVIPSNTSKCLSSIKNVKLSSSNIFSSKMPSLRSLLKQSNLESLHLFLTDILPYMMTLDFLPDWSKLENLNMYLSGIGELENIQDDSGTNKDILVLTSFLQHTPRLTELTLGCGVANYSSLTSQTRLVQGIVENLSLLTNLTLYNILTEPSSHQSLYNILRRLKELKTLSLGHIHMSGLNQQDIEDLPQCSQEPKYQPSRNLIEALVNQSSIAEVCFMYKYGEKCSAEKLCTMMEVFKKEYPNCRTNLSCVYWKDVFM